VIDGKGGVQRNMNIVARGSRIAEITPKTSLPVTYDLSGATLSPGWIDTHVHPNWYFGRDGKLVPEETGPAEDIILNEAANNYAMLMAGFTTVQSVGSPHDKNVRDAIEQGRIPGPRLLTSLGALTDASGSPEQIRQWIRQKVKEGADVVKLFATKSIRDGGTQSMTDAQIQAAISEAKALGKRTVVHAHASPGARVAILAGCTTIEHGTLLDEDVFDLMAKHGVYFDPNFLVLHNYLDTRPKFEGVGNFNEAGFAMMRKVLPNLGKTLQMAEAHKVKLVLGTDAVAGAHGKNAEEFIYRVKDAGQKPMNALLSGTSVAAESLGLGNRIGTVAPGLEADLVATAGNPLDDITNVRQVVFVMKGGKVYKNVPVARAH
jgi:imidazolonepropionase-like amidohydrolase